MSSNAQLRLLNPLVAERLGVSTGCFTMPVQAVSSRLAISGVSSFGYSGTIAHAVLAFGQGEVRKALAFGRAADSSEVLGFGSRGAVQAGGPFLAGCSERDLGRSTFTLTCVPHLTYRRHAFPWFYKKTVTNVRSMANATAHEVHIGQVGSIANLIIQPDRMPPHAFVLTEAMVDVQAVGLNFRDVLNVLGLDPTGTVRPIGGEATGIVSSVGPACSHLLTTEHAYGLVPGSLRTHALCDARYIRCVHFLNAAM